MLSIVGSWSSKAGVDAYAVPDRKVFEPTDSVLQNPAGNAGTLNVRGNGVALLVIALENFRDRDYHFVSPVVFKASDRLELPAECRRRPTGAPPGYTFRASVKDVAAA